MKLRDIYAIAVSMGIAADPRGEAAARQDMARSRCRYEAASPEERDFFDCDSLDNPYGDSRILWGDPEEDISSILLGIDVGTEELLLADRLRSRGQRIDLALSHHPAGRALLNLPRVMELQPGAFATAGVRLYQAQALLDARQQEVGWSVGSGNYQRSVDMARLLDISFMCCHTPCDNMVNTYLTRLFEQEQPDTAGQAVRLLRQLPEYAAAARLGNPPRLAVGQEERAAGRVFVDMTGGAGGPKEYYRLLAQAGVGTVVCMAAHKDAMDEAREAGMSLVIAGHMASDSIGVNLLADRLAQEGLEITACSGLCRVQR